jgi:hypothetical protein
MGRKMLISMILTAAMMLIAQAAFAGTKVYVNLGIPAVDFTLRSGGCANDGLRIHGSYYPVPVAPCRERVVVVHRAVPQPQRVRHVWVEGHYRYTRPQRVWVPGHWEKASSRYEEVSPPRNIDRPDRRQQNYLWEDGDGWEGD